MEAAGALTTVITTVAALLATEQVAVSFSLGVESSAATKTRVQGPVSVVNVGVTTRALPVLVLNIEGVELDTP